MAGLFSNHESLRRLRQPIEPQPDRNKRERAAHSVQRSRRLTDTEIRELVTNFHAGLTITQLVERFGIHRTTVMAHLRRQGVPRPGEWSPAQLNQVTHRYQHGETLDEIAATIGVDPRTVGRQLRRAGVPIRPSGPRRLPR